jgi:hypothetical protein
LGPHPRSCPHPPQQAGQRVMSRVFDGGPSDFRPPGEAPGGRDRQYLIQLN